MFNFKSNEHSSPSGSISAPLSLEPSFETYFQQIKHIHETPKTPNSKDSAPSEVLPPAVFELPSPRTSQFSPISTTRLTQFCSPHLITALITNWPTNKVNNTNHFNSSPDSLARLQATIDESSPFSPMSNEAIEFLKLGFEKLLTKDTYANFKDQFFPSMNSFCEMLQKRNFSLRSSPHLLAFCDTTWDEIDSYLAHCFASPSQTNVIKSAEIIL